MQIRETITDLKSDEYMIVYDNSENYDNIRAVTFSTPELSQACV